MLILALGANDGLRGLSISQMEQNLSSCIELAREKQIKIILAGIKIPPNYGQEYTREFEQTFKNLSKKYNLTLIPFLLKDVAGNRTFVPKDHVISDPENSLTSFEFAPKIYIGINQLDSTGLIRYGSRIWVSHFFRFPQDVDAEQISKRLKAEFSKVYNDQPLYYIYTSKDVNKRLGRLTRSFTGYMGLVSVVTLFLAGIATAYLFRGYLNLKRKEMAVLMSIGTSRQSIWFYISIQLILLGTAASLLATPFDISVEDSFAKENRINLNDILEFEIQGIPFTGQVKNFRKVRWNSFQPNFFLLFQKGCEKYIFLKLLVNY